MKAVIFATPNTQTKSIDEQIAKLRNYCTDNQLSFVFEEDVITDFDIQEEKDYHNTNNALYIFQNLGEIIIRLAVFELRIATWIYILKKER